MLKLQNVCKRCTTDLGKTKGKDLSSAEAYVRSIFDDAASSNDDSEEESASESDESDGDASEEEDDDAEADIAEDIQDEETTCSLEPPPRSCVT